MFGYERKQLSDYFELNGNVDKLKCELYCDIAISFKEAVNTLSSKYNTTEEKAKDMLFGENNSVIEVFTIPITNVFRQDENVSSARLFIQALIVMQPCKKSKISFSYTSYCTRINTTVASNDNSERVYTDVEKEEFNQSKILPIKYDKYFNDIDTGSLDTFNMLYEMFLLNKQDNKKEIETVFNSFLIEEPAQEPEQILKKTKLNNKSATKKYAYKEDTSKVFNGKKEAYMFLKEIKPDLVITESSFMRRKWEEYFTKCLND